MQFYCVLHERLQHSICQHASWEHWEVWMKPTSVHSSQAMRLVQATYMYIQLEWQTSLRWERVLLQLSSYTIKTQQVDNSLDINQLLLASSICCLCLVWHLVRMASNSKQVAGQVNNRTRNEGLCRRCWRLSNKKMTCCAALIRHMWPSGSVDIVSMFLWAGQGAWCPS